MKAWNSTLNATTKPMKRSGFKASHKSSLKAGTKRLRSRGPKMTKIRRSAKGEDCTINLRMVCNYDREKVVLCHENSEAAGKGMALKARDTEAAYGCNACHDVYDRRVPLPRWLTREEVDACFYRGKKKTQERLRLKGLMKEVE